MIKAIIKIIITITLFLSNMNFVKANDILPNFFTSEYKALLNGEEVGTLTRKFYKIGDTYKVESKSSAKVYLSIIPVIDYRDSNSEFEVDEKGKFKSKKYSMKRTGTWLDFFMEIQFNQEKKYVTMSYKDQTKEYKITNELFDNESYLIKLQQDVKKGLKENLKYKIAYKTNFNKYKFNFKENENIELFHKNYISLKYEMKSKSKKIEIWFIPELDFNIAKILITENKENGNRAEFIMSKYSIN